MFCKLCNKEIEKRFGPHINGHRINGRRVNVEFYLELFPEQNEEYKKHRSKPNWNKGLTKFDHPSIMKYAIKSKEYHNKPEIKEKMSKMLKERYEKGDILTPEKRRYVVKVGSDAWVKKVKNSTFEERKEMLGNFVKAGNEAQKKRREFLTPEDYEKLYPFAKGKAAYYNCDFCSKQMIAWFGGKPRPRLRFCDKECWHKYQALHPNYVFSSNTRWYYSEKMAVEFCLHSLYELWFAELLDNNNDVLNWSTTPYVIYYEFEGRKRRYFPDFLVNGKYLIEIKSDYIFKLGPDNIKAKIKAAEELCKKNNIEFLYWQFGQTNFSRNKLLKDLRVVSFIKGLKYDK
jgi:hypothetical protein